MGWVGDLDTGEQVAMLRERMRPGPFAEYLALVAKFYNWAYMCPEANDPGFIDGLIKQYPVELLYTRRRDPTDRRPILSDEIGFETTVTTRLWLVQAVDDAVREATTMIRSPLALQEHYTFVIKANGKAEHQVGCHDDTVLAHAFFIMARRTAPRRTYTDRGKTGQQTPQIVRYGQRKRDDDD